MSPGLLDDFYEYARNRLRNFTGREWLLEKIRAWLEQVDAPRCLLILGERGIGKSAFAAHLWQNHHLPSAVHFCIAGRGGTVEPAAFAQSLHEQLAENLPGFSEAFRAMQEVQYGKAQQPIYVHSEVHTGNVEDGAEVTGVKIVQNFQTLPPENAIDLALRRSLKHLETQNRLSTLVLILVDALDKALTTSAPKYIMALLAQAQDLPEAVRFLLLSRPEGHVLDVFRQVPHQIILAESEENRRDIHAYLERAWDENAALRSHVQDWGGEWDRQTFAERLGKRGEWNFLYLSQILPDVAQGRVARFEDLPAGLDDIYPYLLRTRVGDINWREWGADLMEVLLALQEPAIHEQLTDLLGWEPQLIHQRLGEIAQLLDPALLPHRRYWRHHWALVQFLGDQGRAGKWWFDFSAAHSDIADHYLRAWGGLEAGLPALRQAEARRRHEGYGSRHLATHLLQGRRREDVHRLLACEADGRPAWFEAQEAEGGTAQFIQDVLQAWQAVKTVDREKAGQGQPAPRLGLEVRYALTLASVNSLAGNLPPKLVVALVESKIWEPQQALAYACQMPVLYLRAGALAGLAPHLPQELLGEALAGLAPHLAQLPRPALYPLWEETLPLLACRARRGLLADLRALAPVMVALGGEKAVGEAFRAIQDVGRWWP